MAHDHSRRVASLLASASALGDMTAGDRQMAAALGIATEGMAPDIAATTDVPLGPFEALGALSVAGRYRRPKREPEVDESCCTLLRLHLLKDLAQQQRKRWDDLASLLGALEDTAEAGAVLRVAGLSPDESLAGLAHGLTGYAIHGETDLATARAALQQAVDLLDQREGLWVDDPMALLRMLFTAAATPDLGRFQPSYLSAEES